MADTNEFVHPGNALPTSHTEQGAGWQDLRSACDPRNDITRLLSGSGIGPVVVQRLRDIGVLSITDLQRRGVESTVSDICKYTGQLSWRNRTRALARALAQATLARH